MRLMNSSFIDKIAHSSKNAAMDKLRGSINYSNIIKEFEGITNERHNIRELFELHSEHDFWENYERIYGLTSQIQGKEVRFKPTETQKAFLLESYKRSYDFLDSDSFQLLSADLKQRVERNSKAIVIASTFVNAKIRGEIIEHLITSDDDTKLSEMRLCIENNGIPNVTNPHGLADYERIFDNVKTGTDIKTKVMYLDSQPKGFSIDDILRYLGEKNTVFLFYWVGIEKDEALRLQLLPIFESNMLRNSHIQKHWSGINQRGHIQFDGKAIKCILNTKDYAIVQMTKCDTQNMILAWIDA